MNIFHHSRNIKKVNQVDWFYIVAMLAYVPVGLFGLYFVDFIGLKKSFWVGNAFNVVGTGFRLGWVRCDEINKFTDSHSTARYFFDSSSGIE